MSSAAIPAATQSAVAIGLVVYLVVTYGLAWWVSRRVESVEDYLVAGRSLPLALAWATLMATWFGAATVITAADEVREQGLRAAALEPIGAGLCLIIAGLFFARKLWTMKLLTLSDFFRERFGPRSETLSAIVMIPGYFGWIAVQFLAVAGILELFFGLDPMIGVVLVAVVGTGYTLLGGMWAVTVTDAAQLVILLIGLVVLGFTVLFGDSGGGPGELMSSISQNAPDGYLAIIPTESIKEAAGWFALLAIGALGNLPGQDLTQRIFSAKSANVARTACIAGGIAYIAFGAIPVFLGLVAGTAIPVAGDSSVIVTLTSALLSPALAVIVIVALTSAVMSTIDSAILSPASVMAQNLMARAWPEADRLKLNRQAVLIVAGASLAVAYVGESAFSLLEAAYEIGLMGLFVPLAMGMRSGSKREAPALWTMGFGFSAWLAHLLLGWHHFLGPLGSAAGFEIPTAVPVVAMELGLYWALDRN